METRVLGVRKIVGECNHCMLCCTQDLFAENQADRGRLGWCRFADIKTQNCRIYSDRPDICRQFPTEADFDAGRVPKDCGYRLVTEETEIKNTSVNQVLLSKTPLGNQLAISYFDGARVDVRGDVKARYRIQFINNANGVVVYNTEIESWHFAAATIKYYVDWRIQVWENGALILDQVMDLTGQRVCIYFTSNAVGDSIAWFPYAEEFRRRHNCEVHVSGFHNDLFQDNYPHLHFEKPGIDDSTPYAAGYLVGAFDNDYSKNKNNWRLIPLQQVASDALGLEYREIRPRVVRSDIARPIPGKYVAISEFSTFNAKKWLRPGGWEEVIKYLHGRGLEVVSVSKDESVLDGVVKLNGRLIKETVGNIQYAEAFIGMASGLSWLAWGLNVPVVLISGFTLPISEMADCHRVINPTVCVGCYNDKELVFDRGNWNWCPRNKNFECSTAITPEAVIAALERALKPRAGLVQISGTNRNRVLFLAPHCSTGGMPQYVLHFAEDLINSGRQVAFVEWQNVSSDYTVQRKQLKKLCQFYTLDGDKAAQLRRIIEDYDPGVVHLQEFAETFLSDEAARYLYRQERPYKLIETSHGRQTVEPGAKRWKPDAFVLASQYHMDVWKDFGVPCSVAEYEPPQRVRPERSAALAKLSLDTGRRHILNVGLFTPGKNQGEAFEIARQMPECLFHFVGNQAPNFMQYWKPLMDNKPANCVIWGEREDVDSFYAACDAFLFTSTNELNPLVVKEALAWQMPVLMRKLETYGDKYDGRVQYIDADTRNTVALLRRMFPSMAYLVESLYEKPSESVQADRSVVTIIDINQIGGWMADENRATLEELIKRYRVRSVLEIGSFLGLSAAWFAQRVEKVVCVDPWIETATVATSNNLLGSLSHFGVGRDFYAKFEENLKSLGLWHKITPLRGYSRDVADKAPAADLVYIDGDHSYIGCSTDIRLYRRKAKKILCGDDYTPRDTFGVIQAVNELLLTRRNVGPFWWSIPGRIAVVTPNLNCGKYLKRAIESVKAQTVAADSIVVVDGGSTDDSEQVCKDLGVTWMVQKRGRMGRARNVGVSMVDTDWILPLDADDYIDPTFIERCLEKMDDGVGVVGTGVRWSNGDVSMPSPPFTVERFLERNLLFGCSLIRREAFDQVGGYDEFPETYEDWDLWLRLAKAGWKIDFVNEPLFHCTGTKGFRWEALGDPRPDSSSAQLTAEKDAAYKAYLREKHQLLTQK